MISIVKIFITAPELLYFIVIAINKTAWMGISILIYGIIVLGIVIGLYYAGSLDTGLTDIGILSSLYMILVGGAFWCLGKELEKTEKK